MPPPLIGGHALTRMKGSLPHFGLRAALLLAMALSVCAATANPPQSQAAEQIVPLQLTDAERAWLRQHPTIRLGIDRDFAPYEWIDQEGNYVGLVADFMRLIEQRLGVRFAVAKDKAWHETLEMARRGELDMIGAAVKTADREQYLSFSQAYITNPAIIINDNRHGYVGGLQHLAGKRVAVEEGYFVQELITKEHREIQLLSAKNVHQALMMVLGGQADAYVGDALSASHAIKQAGLLNLGFAGQTRYQSQSSIAVSKREPTLFAIIEKALASIPQQERDPIINHWMGLNIEQGIKAETLFKYAAVVALLFLLSSYWIHRLRKEVEARQRSEAALRESETRLSLAQSAAHIAIWDWDMVDNRSAFSPEYYRLFGLAEGTPHSYQDFLSMVHPEDREAVDTKVNQSAMDPSQLYTVECRVIRATDGAVRWLVSKGRFFCAAGKPLRATGVVYDITERKQAEEKLRLTARVFETTQESIVITDANRDIIDVNTAFTLVTGYPREAVLGKNPRFLKSGHHGPAFYQTMWQTIASKGHWSGEIWNRKKNGESFPEWLTLSALTDVKGRATHYVGIASDISLLKQHEKQLEHIAHYDALTGIPNRVLLADRMRQAIAHTLRHKHLLGVCYLDLDGFKPINDGFGHETGDRVLIEIAQRITGVLRAEDTVARLGGDEFVILLLELKNAGECEATVERLLAAIAEPLAVTGTASTVTASIGVTLFPHDHGDLDTLLRHADQAMYIAKQSGRNRYHLFDAERDRRTRVFSESQIQIRNGIKNLEFDLFYQPKIHMGNGKLVGAEALIRWKHPVRGLLSPAEFLPCLENSELENAIGEWVIDHALSQMDHWRQTGQMVGVSVNIAAGHLRSEHFLRTLRGKLARHPTLPPGALQLEIIEAVALDDIPKVAGIIEACAKMGVEFALDDFGTGYSSLAYLRRLPAGTLKIDQSFVQRMLTDTDDRAIVQGIIALAQAFGRKTIAEGVESAEHCEALLDLGCDIGQGYGIAPPMPADAFADWRQHRHRP